MTNKLRNLIERQVELAYLTGRNHALNAPRSMLGLEPKMVNVGWGLAADKILQTVEKELKKCQKQSLRKK